MKKLLLLLLLSLGFIGSANAAGDVYSCKYKTVEVSGENENDISSNFHNPDITLIVEKKQVTTISINPIDGKSYKDVYKILKQHKSYGLTAMEKTYTSNGVSTLYFNKNTLRFSMAILGLYIATGYSGRCTFMYSQ